MSGKELDLVRDAFASNWIAPLGPHVENFEKEFTKLVGVGHGVALSSGTAALHLALVILGVGPGDEVLCPSLTFSASANPIAYQGATPVFIDSTESSWCLDPDLLEQELKACAAKNKLPKAVMVVDLYGQSADYEQIEKICESYQVPVIEDAAEALGATWHDKSVGGFGTFGIFSFNGNKIITASGGGILVADDEALIDRARFLATQARDPAPHYQHSAIGYNYRLSNILAAVARGQLQVLPERLAARLRNYEYYRSALGDLPGLDFMPEASYGKSNHWLTCITIDPGGFGASREEVRLALERENIESRPIWKPLHMQPVFASCRMRGGRVAERIFEHGLCLPSGSSLDLDQLGRICSIVRKCSTAD
jgi:pyridoxal phosphate-dependent aminotransferase EpsN